MIVKSSKFSIKWFKVLHEKVVNFSNGNDTTNLHLGLFMN